MKLLGALLAAAVVSAQTHSDCDPVKGDHCDPDPAFARNEAVDFTKGANEDLFKPLTGTKLTYDDEKGMVMTCGKDSDAPTIASPEYMFFGELEVEMMAAPGKGIVTSIVLQSDCLDEIDWEWTGHKDSEVQSNYFSKGDDSTFDRGGTHPAPGSMSEFHIYKLVWTQEKLDWIIDGKVVRTLTYADAKGGATYPQTPMQVKLGTWVAGKKDAPEGTKEWAGGQADFSAGPTHAYYKRISITDYAGGVEGAKSYVYTSEAGSWESIKVDTTGGDLAEKKQKEGEDSSSSSSSSSGSKSNSTAALTKPTQTSYSTGPGQTEIPGSGAAGSFAVAGSLAAVGFFTVLFNML